jgi:integrase
MAVRQVRGRWCVEFQQGGTRIFRRCPPGVTKADAQQYEAAIRRDLFAASALGVRPALPIAAALQTWLEATTAHRRDQRMPKHNALTWAPFIEGKRVEDAPDVAAVAIKAWTEAGAAPATINRRLAALKAACRYAWKRGMTEANVGGRIQALREPEGRQVYLTPAEVRRLAQAAPTPVCRAAVVLAAYTGLRAGELLRAVRPKGRDGLLLVPISKTGVPRAVPVAGPARPYLKHLPLGIAYRTLAGQFWIARKAAGMDHVRFHDLRHTAASMLANTGASLPVIGAMLGHKAPATTKRYAHLADKTLRAAVRKMR